MEIDLYDFYAPMVVKAREQFLEGNHQAAFETIGQIQRLVNLTRGQMNSPFLNLLVKDQIAYYEGKAIILTLRETDTLNFFLNHPGQSFTSQQISESIDIRTIRTYIFRLREKIPPEIATITNSKHKGYILQIGPANLRIREGWRFSIVTKPDKSSDKNQPQETT